MLISDYLSSNIIICILFFYLTHFRELGQKYKNIFIQFFVQMKTPKFAFENNWPLSQCISLKKHQGIYVLKQNSWSSILLKYLPKVQVQTD